jgi:hypothetical protein
LIPGCKILYVFLLGGSKNDDLFCLLYSTSKNRLIRDVLNSAIAKAICFKNKTIWQDDWAEAVNSINDFIEKYAIKCKIFLCDDLKQE